MISSVVSMGRWFIDIKSPADVVEKLAYLFAIGVGVAIVVGVVSILGTVGLFTMLGAFALLVIVKWGWLWILK